MKLIVTGTSGFNSINSYYYVNPKHTGLNEFRIKRLVKCQKEFYGVKRD